MYLEKDLARGIDGTFMWLMEEVGEPGGAKDALPQRGTATKNASANSPTYWPG